MKTVPLLLWTMRRLRQMTWRLPAAGFVMHFESKANKSMNEYMSD
jgi:hypothetical protein